jgi:hypothetical protein
VPPPHHHPLTNRLQPLVWLVLLLTGLGLSRSAVLCTKPCCAGHVKLVATCHEADANSATETHSCCRPAASYGRAPDRHSPDEPDPATCAEDDGGCGCHHVRLGVELAPPPVTKPRLTGPVAFLPHRREPQVPMPLAAPPAAAHPPSTGPPPHARRSAHRATIQLLL